MDKEKEITEEKSNQNPENNTISPASEHLPNPEQGGEQDDKQSTTENSKVATDSVEEVKDDTPVATDEVPVAKTLAEEAKAEEAPATPTEEAPEVEAAAPLTSEEDLADHADEDHHEEEEVDYSTFTKEELVEVVKAAGQDDNVVKADNILKEIKPFFDEFRNKERKEALDKFVADGGEPDDFEFKNDELNTRFDANFRLIKDKRTKYYKEREQSKDLNLKQKQAILETLREAVDAEESNISFDKFKDLQNEWKSIGAVPAAHNRTLWANYNALLDRFYDQRSIYFELKELDRKKNLTAKIELCEKAEQLVGLENLQSAIAQLNELHHEFKHLGPVPKEEQEPLWQRFKAASDAVYDRRKGYLEVLKTELEENLVKKAALAEEVQTFTAFESDRIKEWNQKTKDLLELQKQWEAVGGLPKEKGKEVNKQFWSGFKLFFHHKGEFFKRLDVERGENLKQKEVLVEQANTLKESTDWIKTANAMKKLQQDWKAIGPVPEKHRNDVYGRFKEACDHFFNQKRDNSKELDSSFEENLKQKEAICAQIDKMVEDKNLDVEVLRNLQDDFNEIGFVPKKNIGEIKSKYADAVDKFINAIPDISNEERHQIRLENQINKLMNDPNAEQKLYRKEQNIRKQIGKIENDVVLWKNNLEFFASSKTANKLKDEFDEKIESANQEVANLKQQLRMLRSAY